MISFSKLYTSPYDVRKLNYTSERRWLNRYRVYWIENGEVVTKGTVSQVLKSKGLWDTIQWSYSVDPQYSPTRDYGYGSEHRFKTRRAAAEALKEAA